MEFRFVSSVKGHLATRYGTGTPIGATITRDPKTGESTVVWDESAVVAIPLEEWNRHIKEYERLLTHGALKNRDQKDHEACLKRETQVAEEDAAKAKKAAEDAAAKKTEAAGASDAPSDGPKPDGNKPKGKKE